jgi:hypothetical protein
MNIYGGILIRSIKNERSGDIIEGPSLVVDQILKACGVNTNGGIRRLVETIWTYKNGIMKGMENSNNIVYLELKSKTKNVNLINNMHVFPATKKRKLSDEGNEKLQNLKISIESLPIYTSPRVGLCWTNAEQMVYFLKPYRYFVHPRLLKKGRAPLIAGLISQVRDCQEIAEIVGMSISSVSTYYSEYTKGKQSCKIAEFLGKRLNIVMFCRMAGLVESLK